MSNDDRERYGDLRAILEEANKMDEDVTRKIRIPASEHDITDRLAQIKEHENLHITSEYEEAFRAIFQDLSNVLLTGGAGVGKTTFLQKLVIKELERRGIRNAVTATTGIAGSHISGRTLHSWCGFGFGPQFPPGVSPLTLSRGDVQRIYDQTYATWVDNPRSKNKVPGVKKRLRSTEVLVVDEVSMCHGIALLDYIDYFMRMIRDVDKPFGGLQMIFSGDFAQLPPVERFPGPRADWAFMSHSWNDANVKSIEFTEVFRQANRQFASFLNRRRIGLPMNAEEKVYAATFVRQPSMQELIESTHLIPTNKQADEVNRNVLRSYPEPQWNLEMKFVIMPHHGRMLDERTSKLRSRLAGCSLLREELTLRAGLPVLLTFNDPCGKFVNGSRAKVVGYNMVDPAAHEGASGEPAEDELTVVLEDEFKTRLRLTRVKRCIAAHDDPEEQISVLSDSGEMQWLPKHPHMLQFPVIPATGITIHKCVAHDTLLPTMVGVMEINEICSMPQLPDVAGVLEFKTAAEPYIGVEELGYKITTRRGFCLVGSERHPLLKLTDAGEEWTKTPSLQVGDRLRMRSGTFGQGDGSLPKGFEPRAEHHATGRHKLPNRMSTELAWLLGALIGDGCVTDKRDGRMDVTSMDIEVTDRFRESMWELFGLVVTSLPRDGSDTTVVTYAHSKAVRDFVYHLGVPYNKAPAKCIPRSVMVGSVEHQAAFLRGLFDTDGGVNTAVHFTSSSWKLAAEVHVMLANLGIVGTLGQLTDRAWRVNITGVDVVVYAARVGFTIQRKADALSVLAAGSSERHVVKANLGFYPALLAVIVATGIRDELLERQTNTPDSRGRRPQGHKRLRLGRLSHWGNYLARVIRGVAGLTDAHLRALGKAIPHYAELGTVSAKYIGEAMAGNFIDEIVSIERKTALMRDIAVPDGHAFVGNVFVNHNCQGMSLDKCVVDLNRSFAAGQAYVAMSRLRSPEGLTLITDKFEAMVDPDVMRFYRQLRAQKLDRSLGETQTTTPHEVHEQAGG